ncbi:MAG: gamma-glutamyltransferase [Bdellovibrionales bacterium GWB1_55_8]|nr:MAG: gamma-glutamyltransferase [Bdellovibrionales bacterium GWB1_55_8]
MRVALRAFLVFTGMAVVAGCSSVRSKTAESQIGFDPARWDGSVESQEQMRVNAVVSTGGLVVSDDREASEWGAEILRRGGNAVDAAVATAFALAVTRPHFAALGGGGFFLYCPKPVSGKPTSCEAIDYRERAPAASKRDMYVRDGKPVSALSRDGALAIGVPGVPAGLLLALQRHGSMSRSKLLDKPIRLAKDGYRFTSHSEMAASQRWFAFNDEAKRIFGCGLEKEIKPCPVGTRIQQPELAKVLEEISQKGVNGFYQGWVADKIVAGLRSSGGIMSLEDLKSYRPVLRTPLEGDFRGMKVVTMPPPSAGGTMLLQMLGYVERASRTGQLSEGFGAASSIHALTHAMSLSFADRAKYFGDPDHVRVPVQALLAPDYLDQRWRTFDSAKVVIPDAAGEVPREGMHTTHFAVIDRDGNAVSVTTTVNEHFGSGFVPKGTGVVMNDEMDDFSSQPGVPNLFGLVGAEANAIASGKRPLSSMTPVIVRDVQGNARILLGAAGGPRITSSVFLTLVNRLHFGMSLPDAMGAPRFHHQWKPGKLRVERWGFAPDVLRKLTSLGYELDIVATSARMQGLERFSNGRSWAAPDRRGEGAGAAE